MSIASEYTSDRARDGYDADATSRTHVPLIEGYRAIAHQNLYTSALAAAYGGSVMPVPSPALSADADARRLVLLDPTVRQSYDIRTVSVAGRSWSVEAGDDTPEAEHLAQVVETDLRKIRSFSEARVNLAGAFLAGTAYAYIESDLVYRWGTQWRLPTRLQDIDYRTIRFVPRDGRAVRQWSYDEDTRHISTYVDVPDGTPLISVVHGDVQAALGTGTGLVDVLYPIVYNRRQLQNLALEVAETFGKGILTAKIGDLRIDDADAADKLAEWTRTLDNLRRNYNTLVYGESDEFSVVHGPESGLTTMLEWLRYWDDIIRSLTLGASMPFGGGSGAGPGSQARADTEDGVVDDRIAYERERLDDELTEQLVGWYCRQNRAGLYKLGIPPTTAWPRFTIESGEASGDPVEFLDVVERMEKLGAPISIETLFDRTQIPRPLPGETLIKAKEDPAAGMGAMGGFFAHSREPERFAAAAPVGTISQRADGEYEKVAEGEWRRVTDGKTAGDYTDETPSSREVGKTKESTLASRLIMGVARLLGLGPKKQSSYNQHSTVSRKSDVVASRRRGLQELIDKGVDPDRAEVMLDAAQRFTENSAGVRAAQKGTWDGSESDRQRALKTGDAMEDYMRAVGPFDPGTKLIRGVAVPPEVAEQWVPGAEIDMQGAASSWTTNRDIADKFIRTREQDGSVGVVFELDGGASQSASVRGVSNFPHEDEVIVGKDVRYAIREVQRTPDGQIRIKLRESKGGKDE